MSAVATVPLPGRRSIGFRHELMRLAPLLAEPRRAIEQVFLDMGRDLLGCSALLNEITAAHEGLSAEFESDICDRAARHLQAIRDQVEQLAAFQSGEQDHMTRLAAVAAAVTGPLSGLRQAVRAIKLITVNARIAAAGIGGQKHDFDAFTSDMKSLSSSVETAVAAFSDALGKLVVNLESAHSANAAFAARHGNTIALISDRLAANQEIATAHRARAKTKAEEQRVLNGQILMSVAAAVGAMQIGDITRQRVEHVEQVLEELAELADSAQSEPSHDLATTISVACHLQVLQMDDTLEAFDREILGLAGSLRSLASDATAILQAGSREAETLLSAGGSALGAMIEDLRKIRILFDDFGRTRSEIEKTAREVERAVAVMVGHLDSVADIEHNIRLVSLNTTIQCTQLGVEGRALRVVAQELRDLAKSTVATAAAIMDGLREAEALVGRLGDGASHSMAQTVSALAGDAGTAIELFETMAERLQGHVATMTAAGPRVIRQLTAGTEAVSGRREFTRGWHVGRSRIASLAPLDSQSCDPSTVDVAFFARLRSRYTMDSERRLHDALLGTTMAEDTVNLCDEPHAEADVDDFLL